jgi:hypothetical protein
MALTEQNVGLIWPAMFCNTLCDRVNDDGILPEFLGICFLSDYIRFQIN